MAKLNTIADDLRIFADLLDNLDDLKDAIDDEINKANQQSRKLFDIDGLGCYCDGRDHGIQANLQGKANTLSDNYRKIKNSRVMSANVRQTLGGYDRVYVHENTNQSGYPQITSLRDKLSADIDTLKKIL
jgi:Mg2+ and Co2+ transporter CorA